MLSPTPENIKKAQDFLLLKWRERASEYGRDEPSDLSGACKFSALFAREVFGGELESNWKHSYVRLPSDEIIDLTDGSAELEKMEDPYWNDEEFSSRWEFQDSLDSCSPRAMRWAEEFLSMNEVRQYVRMILEQDMEVSSGLPSTAGMTRLFHFIRDSQGPDSIVLDPERFGRSSFSKKDLAVSAVPRTFYYVDPEEKEGFFESSALYSAEVPTNSIYNFDLDPAGVKAEVKKANYGILDMDAVLRKVSGWRMGKYGTPEQGKWFKDEGIADGMFYTTNQFRVVVMFVPVEVAKVS